MRRAIVGKCLDLGRRGDRDDLESVGLALDQVEGRRADRTGGAEDGDLRSCVSPANLGERGQHRDRDQPVEPVEDPAMARAASRPNP